MASNNLAHAEYVPAQHADTHKLLELAGVVYMSPWVRVYCIRSSTRLFIALGTPLLCRGANDQLVTGWACARGVSCVREIPHGA